MPLTPSDDDLELRLARTLTDAITAGVCSAAAVACGQGPRTRRADDRALRCAAAAGQQAPPQRPYAT